MWDKAQDLCRCFVGYLPTDTRKTGSTTFLYKQSFTLVHVKAVPIYQYVSLVKKKRLFSNFYKEFILFRKGWDKIILIMSSIIIVCTLTVIDIVYWEFYICLKGLLAVVALVLMSESDAWWNVGINGNNHQCQWKSK